MKLPRSKTVLEVAVLLQTSEKAVLALIKDQRLRAINTGKGSVRPRWAILDEDLEAFRTGERPRIESIPQYVGSRAMKAKHGSSANKVSG